MTHLQTPSQQENRQHTACIAFSRRLRNIRHLSAMLGVDAVLSPAQASRFDGEIRHVVVWGRKSTAIKALQFASKRTIPVLYLEDGWIRSSAENAHSQLSYSILVDDCGVYYDSRTPSLLENVLNLPADAFAQKATGEQGLQYAASCRETLVNSNITKYNYCKSTGSGDLPEGHVLVVDQTMDDASVTYGGMDQQSFEQMLDAAIDENPGREVIVRTHPDVVTGRRKGYLGNHALKRGVKLVAGELNPLLSIKRAHRVYVGTSQMGYEALLCEKPVTVFGQPFYAGWGLSDDRQPVTRRTQPRTIDELFWATHVHLARYCNPVTGLVWQLHQCLEHVQLQQSYFARNARTFRCYGITAWKQGFIRQYLRSPDGSVSFKTISADLPESAITRVTWGFRRFAASHENETQLPVYRFEDGFIRSQGLGSDFHAPASLVMDSAGLYFDPARASDLEQLLLDHECSDADIVRAKSLKKLILSARLSKYNVGITGVAEPPGSRTQQVLVVGQVEDDESVLRGCDAVRSNTALLQAVRHARPDAWIRYKPHPDVVAGNRQGQVTSDVLRMCANVVDPDASIIDCIDQCTELHTMTSLAGFEALMRGKRVVTYGAPFYSGWGLTEDRQPIARRTRRRTLNELVYLALIAYPRYLDIESGEFTTPEDLVRSIQSQSAMNKNNNTGWSGRAITKVINIVKGLRYAP